MSNSHDKHSAGIPQSPYLDACSSGKVGDVPYVPANGIFNRVIVFGVGGISYAEYNGLCQLTTKYPRLKMTVGGTDVLAPGDVISALQRMSMK